MSLVSIIMPCYNAERFLADAIQSVLSQSYQNWELIIVDDGSTDGSRDTMLSFTDERIRVLSQENAGVSSARNLALSNMRGDFFCFLDADDRLPVNSVKARLSRFESDSRLSFVDGLVVFFDEAWNKTGRTWSPTFTGPPLKELALLNGKCFAGPTWMIRRDHARTYQMKAGLTHGEDMLFYMELARRAGSYAFIKEEVLHYRRHRQSAMRNAVALEKSYWEIYRYIAAWEELSWYHRLMYKFRVKKFMSLEYLHRGMVKEFCYLLFR